jgi:hypothetical protein
VIALGSVPDLKESLGRETVIRLEGVISSGATRAVQSLPLVKQAVVTAVNGINQLTVVAPSQDNILPTLINTLTAQGAILQKITPEEVTLEDVFIAHTGRTLAEDTTVGSK